MEEASASTKVGRPALVIAARRPDRPVQPEKGLAEGLADSRCCGGTPPCHARGMPSTAAREPLQLIRFFGHNLIAQHPFGCGCFQEKKTTAPGSSFLSKRPGPRGANRPRRARHGTSNVSIARHRDLTT
eukprot:CAMPEP_0174907772 /NCGR_PEP_ID=MMETSP0167-20121228/62028_1 /TAXON_ID=38298 /ORGANISM="Rhodella maculata, Strain CCMP736" /LENGTH=128 /DNA_ID=CAMNT_0016151333 /DNA_START=187 /DNA_END=569 /DNA_ORIENTATION=+